MKDMNAYGHIKINIMKLFHPPNILNVREETKKIKKLVRVAVYTPFVRDVKSGTSHLFLTWKILC